MCVLWLVYSQDRAAEHEVPLVLDVFRCGVIVVVAAVAVGAEPVEVLHAKVQTLEKQRNG